MIYERRKNRNIQKLSLLCFFCFSYLLMYSLKYGVEKKMAADQTDVTSLLCQEVNASLKIGDIRAHEGFYERFVSNDTHVVIYIPSITVRKAMNCHTSDFDLCSQNSVFRAFILIESSDKSVVPNRGDVFVAQQPECTFTIRRVNRSNKGLRRNGMSHLESSRRIFSKTKNPLFKETNSAQDLLFHLGHESYTPPSLQTMGSCESLLPVTKSMKRPRTGSHAPEASRKSKKAYKPHSDLPVSSLSKTCYPTLKSDEFRVAILGGSILTDMEKAPTTDAQSKNLSKRKNYHSELSAAYGFSGVTICSIRFVSGQTPFFS